MHAQVGIVSRSGRHTTLYQMNLPSNAMLNAADNLTEASHATLSYSLEHSVNRHPGAESCSCTPMRNEPPRPSPGPSRSYRIYADRAFRDRRGLSYCRDGDACCWHHARTPPPRRSYRLYHSWRHASSDYIRSCWCRRWPCGS